MVALLDLFKQFSGQQEPPLVECCGAPVHKAMQAPLEQLVAKAEQAGFEFAVASGYRNFSRQRMIWNAKASGDRVLLASDGSPLQWDALSPKELVFAILRWSALPGASRHHWGSEIDIYERSSMPADYALQLTVEETQQGGVFYAFYCWLEQVLREDPYFYRPYTISNGGVAAEPWHLSFKPIASEFEAQCFKSHLLELVIQSDILLKDTIILHFEEIYDRFITPPAHYI